MRFFIPKPFAITKQQACEAHECMRNFAKKIVGLNTTDRKIYHIEFVRNGDIHEIYIDQPEYDSGEIVIAILDARGKYLICTPHNGGYQGKPIIVSKRCTELTIEFDE